MPKPVVTHSQPATLLLIWYFYILDIIDHDACPDMVFNYLMVSSLAAAIDQMERQGMRPTGGEF